MANRLRPIFQLGLCALIPALLHCAARTEAPSRVAPNPAVCQANKSALISLLQELPATSRQLALHTELPTSTLGSIVGEGQTIEIGEKELWINGEGLNGSEQSNLQQLRDHFDSLPSSVQRIYVATSQQLLLDRLRTVLLAVPERFELQLLFAAPSVNSPKQPEGTPRASAPSLTSQLAQQRDPVARTKLANTAYRSYARCGAVSSAIQSVSTATSSARWPQLRQALLNALPQCECESLDREQLGQVLVAEQRAGAGTLGSVPLNFLRDERCGASIPRRSTQWLLQEIEVFDEEFSGEFRGEAMRFTKVVTNERLQRVMCPALPGETLAALQRKNHILYWKLPSAPGEKTPQCQGWQFEALERGSPMGNWRPVVEVNSSLSSSSGSATGPANSPPPAIHFWQGAEEIRLYGPMQKNNSKATEPGPWSCSQEFRMVGVNPQSIELEQGRWFFSQSACQASTTEKDTMRGCIADLARGKIRDQTSAVIP